MKNLTGMKIGTLTVLEKTEKRHSHEGIIYKCRCDCGNIIEKATGQLMKGKRNGIMSCGCRNAQVRGLYKKKLTNNTSGYTGVVYHKQNGKWWARIEVNGKQISGGLYKDINKAIEARKRLEAEYAQPIIDKYEEKIKGGEENA